MARADERHEVLDEHVVTDDARMLLGGGIGVLEADRHVQRAGGDARVELVEGSLDGVHARALERRDRRGHEHGQRAGKRAHPQRHVVRTELGHLRVGQGQAVGQCVGVGEQQRARVGDVDAARAALEQPGADLALERRDLLGHGGLGQRELARGRRERTRSHYGTQREQTARIVHKRGLCTSRIHDLH